MAVLRLIANRRSLLRPSMIILLRLFLCEINILAIVIQITGGGEWGHCLQ